MISESLLKYFFEKSLEFRARNTEVPIKFPILIPTVWHGEAKDEFEGWSISTAQASTAISYKAKAKTTIVRTIKICNISLFDISSFIV